MQNEPLAIGPIASYLSQYTARDETIVTARAPNPCSDWKDTAKATYALSRLPTRTDNHSCGSAPVRVCAEAPVRNPFICSSALWRSVFSPCPLVPGRSTWEHALSCRETGPGPGCR